MELKIVTGMSGAGKTNFVQVLEDMGYYCVDNLPPRLLRSFAGLCMQAENQTDKVAIVMDVRSREVFGDIFEGVSQLLDDRRSARILFLDCEDSVLIRRYKETRRSHPLMGRDRISIEQALSAERPLLERIRESADYVIDTTYLSAKQLRERVVGIFLDDKNQAMLVNCMSFGFKYGLPREADLVFDVRCLPNPFYLPELKYHTGLEAPVREYVLKWEQTQNLIPKLFDLVDYLLPLYRDEGKTQLTVAVGCTGGKHRSVVFAQLLGEHLQEEKVWYQISHRDIEKDTRKDKEQGDVVCAPDQK